MTLHGKSGTGNGPDGADARGLVIPVASAAAAACPVPAAAASSAPPSSYLGAFQSPGPAGYAVPQSATRERVDDSGASQPGGPNAGTSVPASSTGGLNSPAGPHRLSSGARPAAGAVLRRAGGVGEASTRPSWEPLAHHVSRDLLGRQWITNGCAFWRNPAEVPGAKPPREDIVRELKAVLGPSTFEVGFGLKEFTDIAATIVYTESDWHCATALAGALSLRDVGRFDPDATVERLSAAWTETFDLVVTDESYRAIMRAALAMLDDLKAQPGVVDGPRLVAAVEEALVEPAPDPERPSIALRTLLEQCLGYDARVWFRNALHEAAHVYVAARVGFVPMRVEMS
jgi:hypothetical protein